MKKHDKTYDLSACVTGILLAFVCPVTVAYWQIVLGAAFAILLVKMLFGGLGRNVVNPALAGRAFMMSWPVAMSTWIIPGMKTAAPIVGPVDIATAATPLANMHQGLMPEASIWELAWGTVGGCIGETSAIMLLVGLVYLLIRKVIRITIPAAYIGTVAVLTLIFPMGNPGIQWMLCQIFGGGLMLGAIFMATDYVTSPLTTKGQIVYGIGCGALTVLIRYFGGYNEGVSYAILIMNCCVVLLDRIGRPTKFGAPKKEAAK
jgi:electron transport complex protein RnfD